MSRSPEASAAVRRLLRVLENTYYHALRSRDDTVLVLRADLALLLSEMPCGTCVWVQNCKDQAEVIRTQWEAIAEAREGRNG